MSRSAFLLAMTFSTWRQVAAIDHSPWIINHDWQHHKSREIRVDMDWVEVEQEPSRAPERRSERHRSIGARKCAILNSRKSGVTERRSLALEVRMHTVAREPCY
jgi:hypothetical protein